MEIQCRSCHGNFMEISYVWRHKYTLFFIKIIQKKINIQFLRFILSEVVYHEEFFLFDHIVSHLV